MLKILKNIFRPLFLPVRTLLGKRRLTNAAKQSPFKMIIGASGVFEKGWTPTDIQYLNLLNDDDWEKFMRLESIDAILAEHVWEHLTVQDGRVAAENCFKYLKKGGHFRVAVPDGYHPNSDYINYVKPGGHGAGADDHKILYTYKTFSKLFESVGFKVELLEYFDETGQFHFTPWEKKDGMINRSKRFDKRNQNGTLGYTSIILDAKKV